MSANHARRTAEQRIADLEAQIQKIKARALQQTIKKDPALRHVSGAVRAIGKALDKTENKEIRKALAAARSSLQSCLSLSGPNGAGAGGTLVRRGRAANAPDPEKVLDYLRLHAGSRSEQISSEFETDAASLRPVLHRLRDEGRITVEGKARAMTYSASQ